MIRDSLERMLTDVGYYVELSSCGDDAVSLFKKARASGHPFDIVILGLTIPGGTGGKEVLEELLHIDKQTRAVVSSGYANNPIMSDFRKYGFIGVLKKPYESAKLYKVLCTTLQDSTG